MAAAPQAARSESTLGAAAHHVEALHEALHHRRVHSESRLEDPAGVDHVAGSLAAVLLEAWTKAIVKLFLVP